MASFETIARISASLEAHEIPHAIVGGTVTGALTTNETQIIPSSKLLVAPESSDSSLLRENGTRRDADILILSANQGVIADAKTLANEASHDELAVSAFGFQRWRDFESRGARLGAEVLRYYTSTREQDESGTVYHRVYPLQATVPWTLLEGWRMQLPKDMGEIRIMDPRYHMISYATRSVGGLRPKDAKKYAAAQALVAQAFYAADSHDLQSVNHLKQVLDEIQTASVAEAVKLHGFIGLKSKVIHLAERQTWIVDTFQRLRLDERLLKRFVN